MNTTNRTQADGQEMEFENKKALKIFSYTCIHFYWLSILITAVCESLYVL